MKTPSKDHLTKLVSSLCSPTGGIKKLVGTLKSQKKSPLEAILDDLVQESFANLEVSAKVLRAHNEVQELVDVYMLLMKSKRPYFLPSLMCRFWKT